MRVASPLDLADRGDATVLDRDVAAVRGLAGAVDDARVLDDEVIAVTPCVPSLAADRVRELADVVERLEPGAQVDDPVALRVGAELPGALVELPDDLGLGERIGRVAVRRGSRSLRAARRS